jgi:cytochrome P450
VQEVARHDAPVQNTRRFVARPVEIEGVPLAAGDAVLLVLGAANRDPALNAEPDAFRLDRTDRRMLGFGHGAHACPGQGLACAVAAAALQTLLARGDLDVDGMRRRGWHYRRSVNARIPVFD